MVSYFEAQSKALEDAFFEEQDRKLIEKLHAMKKMEETKDALRKVSGIDNDHVLEKLVELNIRPETVAALSVVPLVEVAWADGNVDSQERQTLLTKIDEHGIKKGSVEYALVEAWLSHRPTTKLLDAWTHMIRDVSGKLNAQDLAEFRESLLHDVRSIASASGGFFGVGKVSPAEKAAIDKLQQAFER